MPLLGRKVYLSYSVYVFLMCNESPSTSFMQKVTLKFPKLEACHNFWQPLVKDIYAQNADAFSLHKRDVLAAL